MSNSPKTIACVPFVLALVCSLLGPALAQTSGSQSKPRGGPMPRMPNGRPDLNGVWDRPYVPDMTRDGTGQKGTAQLPFTAAGLADWKGYDAANGDYTGSCMPFGMSRSINSPYPLQIVQNDRYVALLFEQNSWFHVTPIDGRPHLKDPDPTWFGSSVGHWEGDTLVIDSIAFNGKIRIDTIGHPVSEQLHTIERFRRRDLGHIDYVLTIDDPKTYTKPWDSVRTWTLRPDWEIMEYSCEENNKDILEGHIKAGVQP